MSSIIDFAEISLQGRLTDDPEVTTTKNGQTRCRFTVATNRRMGGGEEKTSYIPVTVFGKTAVNCGEYLSKGRGVHVSGEFETDKYTDRNGIKRTGFGVIARNVIFGPGGSRNEDRDNDDDNTSTARGRASEYLQGRGSRRR